MRRRRAVDTDVEEYAIDRSATKGAGVIDVFTGGGWNQSTTRWHILCPTTRS